MHRLSQEQEKLKNVSTQIQYKQMVIDTKIDDLIRLIKENESNDSQLEQLELIQSDIQELSNKLEVYSKDLDNLRKELESQKVQIEQEQNSTKKQKETIEQCKNMIENLKKEKQKIQIDLEKLKQEKQKIQIELENVIKEKQRIEILQEDYKLLQQTIKDQFETIKQSKAIINEQNLSKQELLEEIQKLKTGLKRSSDQQVILQAVIQSKNAKIQQQERYFNSEMKIKDKSIIELKNIEDQLQKLISDKNDALKKQERDFNSEMKTKDESIIELKKIVDKSKLQLSECNKNCEELNKQIKQQLETISTQTETINQFSVNQQQLFEDIDQLKKKSKISTDLYLQQQIIDLKQSETLLQTPLNEIKKEQNQKDDKKNTKLSFFEIPRELKGHQNKIKQVIISQDGSIFFSNSSDQTIKVWDTKHKQIIQKIQLDHDKYQMAISSNNEYLVYYYFQINLYNLKQNKFVNKLLTVKQIIETVVFSQDSKYLLAGGFNKKILFWRMEDMNQFLQFETSNEIKSIIISPDNEYISCITGLQGTIYIWNFQKKINLIEKQNCHEYGFCLCSSTDSSIYISSGANGPIKIWKLSQLNNKRDSFALSRQIDAGSMNVITLITIDKQYIISMCNRDGKIMIFEVETGQFIQQLDSGEKSLKMSSISMSNDMKVLICSNFTNYIQIWKRK